MSTPPAIPSPTPPPTDPQHDEAVAKRRFFLLSVMRFAGVAVVMFGLALMVEKVPGLEGDIGRYAGAVLVIMGTFDVTVLPLMLVRRWKRADAAR